MGVKKNIYNPFSAKFWTKENMFKGGEEGYNKMKSDINKVREENRERDRKAKDVGNKITKVGMKLTVMITIPILLTVFFGIFGMIIGGIIFLVSLINLFK